jgi:hypothetical protein
MAMGIPHCAEAGQGVPWNIQTYVKQLCLIRRYVSIISSFLIKLKDCHT